MRTLIQGGWVVGYSGSGHELIPNGCVVFEDDHVIHVGPTFDGPVDRRVDATGKLVSPGLINCHLHAATNAGQAVFLDGLKADYFGSNFVGYVAPRRGIAGLERAVAFIKEYDGAYSGRIRAMLYPGQLDTCTPELLRQARRWADDLGVPMQLHAAMNQREFHHILEQHGQTPIQLLHSIGFLKPRTGLGHCVFHNDHSWCHYPYADDLKLLADSGVTVVHAPYKYAKMGVKFESFERYRALGINIALGTDTYPQDLIHEMRWAALMCRLADGSFRVGRPQDVFDAATLGGARHLGRDDLGRLAPGAKADIIVVDLRHLHYGAVHDPIKALVDCGSGRDVETVIVDGQVLVEGGRAARIDEQALLNDVQAEGERLWKAIPQWHWTGKPLDEIVPPSYPIRGAH